MGCLSRGGPFVYLVTMPQLELSEIEAANLLAYLERVACYEDGQRQFQTKIIKDDVLSLIRKIEHQTGKKLSINDLATGKVVEQVPVVATSSSFCTSGDTTGLPHVKSNKTSRCVNCHVELP